MSLASFLLIYVFGGLTFLPLLGGLMMIIIFPPWTWRLKRKETIKFDVSPEDPLKFNSTGRDDSSCHKFGWLRVTREFDLNNPNNGASSGSTFGNMMKQGIASFMEGSSNSNKTKRTKDSFFAVLKYNTLFMYESERQLDWKGIIIVSNHDVTIFPEQLPDNEIFTKVNSIKLTKKPSICAEMALNLENHNGSSTNYYLFCNTGVEKEDWYFALQRSSKLETNDNSTGKQIHKDKSQFDSFAMNHLLKTLYSNDDHMQTQWLNAILGRIFLSVYKTQAIKEYFIRKLVRKIKKVKKPGFLSDIQIRSVDVGDGIPYITNPELIKLSPEGELNVDINLNYTGCFRVEIETEAIISVTRLKHIKVPLVLAVVLRGLQGKMLVRIKPPPTNRLWIGFYDMPKLDLLIEPIVSETQLKFSPIINAIESKIHEMIMDSLVLPNMDDVPFFNSFGMGGIYEGEVEQLQQQADTQQEAEVPTTPTTPSTLSSTDSEKEMSKSVEEESVVADVPSALTANEELRQVLNSAPGKLESVSVKSESVSVKSDATKVEVANVNINASIATPIKAESTTESNSSSSSWTSRATKIKSAFHESFSEPNLLKANRLRSISKQFIKQRTDDSSTTIVKEPTKEPVNESNGGNKESLPSSTTSNSSNSSIQNTASSQSTLRRWSQSVSIRRRTGFSGILNNASVTSNINNNSNDNSNNTNSSDNTNNNDNTNNGDNTNNSTSNTPNNISNNTESNVQKSQINSTESIPIILSTDTEDSVDKQVLAESFAPLSSSPLNISPLSTSPPSVVSPTITSSPSRSTSMESLNLPTYSHSTKSTTQSDTTAPTPPPSPTKSPKEHPDLHIPHSPHSSPHSFSSSTKSTSSYNRDLFLSENTLNDNEFFPEVTPSILNTPVEELHSVLG